jgi:hypothetical protein
MQVIELHPVMRRLLVGEQPQHRALAGFQIIQHAIEGAHQFDTLDHRLNPIDGCGAKIARQREIAVRREKISGLGDGGVA